MVHYSHLSTDFKKWLATFPFSAMMQSVCALKWRRTEKTKVSFSAILVSLSVLKESKEQTKIIQLICCLHSLQWYCDASAGFIKEHPNGQKECYPSVFDDITTTSSYISNEIYYYLPCWWTWPTAPSTSQFTISAAHWLLLHSFWDTRKLMSRTSPAMLVNVAYRIIHIGHNLHCALVAAVLFVQRGGGGEGELFGRPLSAVQCNACKKRCEALKIHVLPKDSHLFFKDSRSAFTQFKSEVCFCLHLIQSNDSLPHPSIFMVHSDEAPHLSPSSQWGWSRQHQKQPKPRGLGEFPDSKVGLSWCEAGD